MGFIMCKSKIQDNSTKAKKKMEIYYNKVLILYMKQHGKIIIKSYNKAYKGNKIKSLKLHNPA